MKLIVGLGNPGKEYEGTRHNVGFYVVDTFVGPNVEWKINSTKEFMYVWLETEGQKLEVIKPQTLMNKSGKAVKLALEKDAELIPKNILVVHDDWAFDVGEARIQQGKGANRHNGVQSIIDALGTNNFWRLRVGVGGQRRSEHDDPKEYVLSKFSKSEKKILDGTITATIVMQIKDWLQNEN